MVQAKRAFRIRLQVLAAAAGSLTLLGAILAFAYTTFQNDVDGVPIPSRWANASFTWVLNNPGTPPGNVDTTDQFLQLLGDSITERATVDEPYRY
jgi:hypothetical protein